MSDKALPNKDHFHATSVLQSVLFSRNKSSFFQPVFELFTI